MNKDDAKYDVEDWMRYAEDDIIAAMRMSQQSCNPPLAKTCSDCQQAVEKILKAYIIANENKLSYIHELEPLGERCQQYSSDFEKFSKAYNSLSKYAKVRYPPRRVNRRMVEKALKDATEIFVHTKSKLAEMGYTVLNATAKFNEISTKDEIIGYMHDTHLVRIRPEVETLITKIINSGRMTPSEICQSLEEQLFVAGGILRWKIQERNGEVTKATLGDDFVITLDIETNKYFVHYIHEIIDPTPKNTYGQARAIAGEYAINRFLERALIELSN